MSDDPGPGTPQQAPASRSQTGARIYWVCYGLLGMLLVFVIVQRYLYPLIIREPIGVASTQAASVVKRGNTPIKRPELTQKVEHRIDPNVADWPELTRLPRIGETIAKRIVAYRIAHTPPAGQADADAPTPVFRRPADLEAVRGIGPKTVSRIAPLLRFPAPPTTASRD